MLWHTKELAVLKIALYAVFCTALLWRRYCLERSLKV